MIYPWEAWGGQIQCLCNADDLSRNEDYFFSSITSVDLITAETVSPTFSFISSALRLVITLSIKLSPTLTVT